MGLIVKNGTCVGSRESRLGDIACRDGKIVAVGPDLVPEVGDRVIDASGQYVFPGGVDPHVHMSLPVMGTVSSDDFESGTAAGVAGGTTTVIDFVHPERGEDPLEALAARRREAVGAVADYGLHMAVTWWGEGVAESMARCVRDEGICSFKVYLAYLDSVGLADRELIRVMDVAGKLNALVVAHAEHGEIVDYLQQRLAEDGRLDVPSHPLSRPPEAEGEATWRAAVLAHLTGASLYIVHVTCEPAVRALEAAQRQGWKVCGETCPQYLLLDDSVYDKDGFEAAAYVVAPPIRPIAHQQALWAGLEGGTLDVVATDHCPFNLQGQKEIGHSDFRRIPGGAAGIEHRLALLYTHGVVTGRFDLCRFVDLVSTRPAKIFGLYPRKGSLRVGADADLVVWDPQATGTLSAATDHHHCDRSIYEGFAVQGAPSSVIVGGRLVLHDGDLRVERGAGRFLRRSR